MLCSRTFKKIFQVRLFDYWTDATHGFYLAKFVSEVVKPADLDKMLLEVKERWGDEACILVALLAKASSTILSKKDMLAIMDICKKGTIKQNDDSEEST